MLTSVLLAAAVATTAPVLAQTAPAPAGADPAPVQAGATATVAPPPASADQVAAVVDRNFASYDTNGDGQLDEPEFAAWMVALKAQGDPATDANAPATKQWNRAAFAQADTDRSRSLTKAELTGFFSPAAAS